MSLKMAKQWNYHLDRHMSIVDWLQAAHVYVQSLDHDAYTVWQAFPVATACKCMDRKVIADALLFQSLLQILDGSPSVDAMSNVVALLSARLINAVTCTDLDSEGIHPLHWHWPVAKLAGSSLFPFACTEMVFLPYPLILCRNLACSAGLSCYARVLVTMQKAQPKAHVLTSSPLDNRFQSFVMCCFVLPGECDISPASHCLKCCCATVWSALPA